MFFLLRCLLWLGLVFSQIAEHEGSSFAVLTQPTSATLAASATNIKQRAIDSAAAACRDHAEACLALASQAVRAVTPGVQKVQDPKIQDPKIQDAKIQDAKIPDARIPEPKMRAPGVDPRHDTLRDADRLPAWRLRPSNGA